MVKKTRKQNNTNEVFNRVVTGLQNIIERGEYEKFLKFRKSFSHYSFNNLILIYTQFPDATRVAGKSKWEQLKRNVIKRSKKDIYNCTSA